MSLRAFALRASVPVYLVGGVSTYKHVLYKHVCVYGPHVQSLIVHRVAIPGVGVCFVCSNACVYRVYAHT